MALTTRTNGSSGSNIIQASWFNDFNNLFKGVMTDQPVTFGNSLTVSGNSVLNGGINTNTIRDGTNGNPALDLSAGTGAVTFPRLISPGNPASSQNGTSGSIALWTPIWGSGMKLAIITPLAYVNTVAVNLIFPSSIARGFFFIGDMTTNTWTVAFQLGGTVVSPLVITALAIGGGTPTSTTAVHHNSFGTVQSTIDRLVWGNTAGFTQQSAAVILGV